MSERDRKNRSWAAESGSFPVPGVFLRYVLVAAGVVFAGLLVLVLGVGRGAGAGGGLMDRLPPEARREFRGFSVPLLSGGTLDESALQGRVTLVNVWASWCGPCRRELPELARISDSIASPEFQLVTLNDDISNVLASSFLVDLGLTDLTVGLGGGRIQGALGFSGLPRTMLVDRTGRTAYVWVGFGGAAQIRDLQRMVLDELEAR